MSVKCLVDVLAQPLRRVLFLLVGARVAQRADRLERKLGVDDQRAVVAGRNTAQSGRLPLESVNWNS